MFGFLPNIEIEKRIELPVLSLCSCPYLQNIKSLYVSIQNEHYVNLNGVKWAPKTHAKFMDGARKFPRHMA